MKHPLKLLGNLSWPVVLLLCALTAAAAVYYTVSVEQQEDPRILDRQVAQLNQRIATIVRGIDDGKNIVIVEGGGLSDVTIGRVTSGSVKGSSATSQAVERPVSTNGALDRAPSLTARALADASQRIDEAERKLAEQLEQTGIEDNNAKRQIADARRQLAQAQQLYAQYTHNQEQMTQALGTAVEGEIRRAVSMSVADYRIRSNLTFLALVASLILAVLISKAMLTRQRAAETRTVLANSEAERARLSKEMVETRLAMMQAQIEPHFLFNTMASVQHLIEVDPPKAAGLQRNLIRYLRAAVPSMRETGTTLDREIKLVSAYLGICKARMEGRLEYSIDVSATAARATFPTMVLTTLVENAVKHGLEQKPEGGSIRIFAEAQEGRLRVVVADTGIGFSSTPGAGVGLANIRERLKLLYGGRASMVIQPNQPGTLVSIEIPLRNKESSTEPARP
jgi:hypothetical protein